MLDEPLHQLMPQRRLGVHQPLGVLVRAARPALDEVAGDGERCAGEGEQRHAVGEFGGEDVDGLAARTARRLPARMRLQAVAGRRRREAVDSQTGPVPGATSMPNPTAWAGTTMSLYSTAASTP